MRAAALALVMAFFLAAIAAVLLSVSSTTPGPAVPGRHGVTTNVYPTPYPSGWISTPGGN